MTGSLVKTPDLEVVASFQKTQYAFAAHLRDPQVNPAPEDIEDRRMKIYRDLVYNNIESFISSGFPILRSLINDNHWHQMVRDFVRHHQSHTPYFLEITQEFLKYLQEERAENVDDLPYMLELAHYEWVELALDVSSEEIPNTDTRVEDILSSKPEVSPLAWRLSYQYPVHRLGSDNHPQEQSEDPTFLVVYRNRVDEVKFLEANAVTLHLLQLFEVQAISAHDALLIIAEQLGLENPDIVFKNGKDLIAQLYSLDILI